MFLEHNGEKLQKLYLLDSFSYSVTYEGYLQSSTVLCCASMIKYSKRNFL